MHYWTSSNRGEWNRRFDSGPRLHSSFGIIPRVPPQGFFIKTEGSRISFSLFTLLSSLLPPLLSNSSGDSLQIGDWSPSGQPPLAHARGPARASILPSESFHAFLRKGFSEKQRVLGFLFLSSPFNLHSSPPCSAIRLATPCESVSGYPSGNLLSLALGVRPAPPFP